VHPGEIENRHRMHLTKQGRKNVENPNPESTVNTEKLTLDIKRFSDLSSEMVELLSNLSQKINKSAAGLQDVQSALDMKKKELATLNEIEMLTASLEQQIQDLRQQKENLDHIIAEQRSAWEKEIERRTREEKEYIDDLNARRRQEEQDYQKAWTAEQERGRRRLDEELRAIQLEKQDAQVTIETDLQERELLLKKKELEWSQLIQELEQFLTKLERRHWLHDTLHAVWQNEATLEQPGQSLMGSTSSTNMQDEPELYAPEGANEPDSDPEDGSILGNGLEDERATNGGNGSILGREWEEEQRHSLLARRDSAPLKFSPKRSAGPKSDV
jgi:hypothetical protein